VGNRETGYYGYRNEHLCWPWRTQVVVVLGRGNRGEVYEDDLIAAVEILGSFLAKVYSTVQLANNRTTMAGCVFAFRSSNSRTLRVHRRNLANLAFVRVSSLPLG